MLWPKTVFYQLQQERGTPKRKSKTNNKVVKEKSPHITGSENGI